MNQKNNFKMLREKYHKKPIVELMKFLSNNDFIILEKLNIVIENKLYTEKEFEKIYSEILSFYEHDSDDNIIQTITLNEKNIDKKDLERILNVFHYISLTYEF